MTHRELRVLSLSIITLLTACAAETDTGEGAPEKAPLDASVGDAATPEPDAEADETLKARLDELTAQYGGPVNDAYFGNLGSQLFSPVVPNASTNGQSNSFQPTCGFSNNAPDAYYTWTAPTTGRYIFTTANSYFDTILEVRSFSNPSISLGCNDDTGGTLDSAVAVNLTAGQAVYVIVDGYGSASGTFRLTTARGNYPAGWTPWRNRDVPSGNGDYETLADFVNAGQACANPTAIECQTVGGAPASSTGEVYGCKTTVGGYCRVDEQPDGSCLDYRVRFLCP